ncbi:hypothetical protein [Serratia inhibens]|uniref:hypothetical protein n=1 Tax=Serratia inhibens TaxID=2338073 RepID=UPI0002EA41BB|nr:hypothetical protein [Serratia inhibens]ANS40620.1 hypothetical protein Q5A_000500 [Serratia inhibens PRI-2C]
MRNISMSEMKNVSGGSKEAPLPNLKDLVDPGFNPGFEQNLKLCWLGRVISKVKDFIQTPKWQTLPGYIDIDIKR